MKQNVTVKNVIDDGDGFSITSKEGNLFFLSKEKAQGKVPKVGDIITLHTYGGCLIRGMDINSVVAMMKGEAGTVVKVTCGKQFRGIGFRTVDTQFVISLFVASGIDGGPHLHPFGDDQDIPDSLTVKTERRT